MREHVSDDPGMVHSASCSAEPALPTLVALGRPLLTALATARSSDFPPPSTSAREVASDPVLEHEIADPGTLFGVIEADIIPRLMLLHRSPANATAASREPSPRRATLDASDHADFLEVLRFQSEAAVRESVRRILDRGVPRNVVFVDLLGGAAKALGELWRRDECSFADVTVGLCRVHMVIREESSLFDVGPGGAAEARRVLLTTAAGDQHILGAVLVAEFFRQDGWQVSCEPGSSPDTIAGLLATRTFDILGLSLSRITQIQELRAEITAYRKASRNPGLGVMVGGQVFESEPDLVEWVGADGFCLDARNAPDSAAGVLEKKRRLATARAGRGPLA